MSTTSRANFSGQIAVICRRSLSTTSKTYFDGISLWIVEPTFHSIAVYSIAIPIISILGIIGNALILCVLCKGNFKASVFTYLTVLAAADLVTCVMLLFSGLARGVFWCENGWLQFDVFVYLPVVSASSNLAVWATMCVAVDRLAIVFSLPKCKTPKFCDYEVARRLMIFFGCFAVLITVPYCLIFTYNDQGDLVTTRFFHSWLYNLQNWLQFVMFGMIPAVLLVVTNMIMCQSVKKTLRKKQLVLQYKNIREGNRLRDQARMTVMLIGIVFVFVLGEVPTHLASRRGALSLLYGGDLTKVSEYYMERFRMYATLMNAISSSTNFVLYCLLNQRFLSHLKHLLTGKAWQRSSTIKCSVPYAMSNRVQ
ncbi:PREDICTED: probable G-protein coupled receptor B0563.6 [Eufriesea mexicana]|uniref:probable G-protein coupled receptor B0563.6 n=1 Tax=Eufriesea mexicana TaxID=516756 RepID=UPI00083C1B47|nr:PREDICTED: probable G-protein coupled receptor B0563.6 [Eufriesea mexicana]